MEKPKFERSVTSEEKKKLIEYSGESIKHVITRELEAGKSRAEIQQAVHDEVEVLLNTVGPDA